MNEPPDSDEHRFTEQERITANLRLRSIPAAGRAMLGLFFFIPPVWRGPVAIVALFLLGYLVLRIGPGAVKWMQSIGQ